MPDILDDVKGEVRRGVYRLTVHAEMRITQRHITVKEVEEVLLDEAAEVIEDYHEDPRGPSCLVLGTTRSGRRLHVQCANPPGVAIITAYEPNVTEWVDWRRRRGCSQT